jgi:DNA-binding response OmpR family regulator
LDEAGPDVIVMPAADFLDLPREPKGRSGYIVYGPVALMARAFEWGCVDYIREPWSLPELYARAGRLQNLKFSLGGAVFRLSGSTLRGREAGIELKPVELCFLRLLLRNAPMLVTREAAFAALSIETRDDTHVLGRYAASLRHSLEAVEPGSGRKLHAVRGLGYRLDASACG